MFNMTPKAAMLNSILKTHLVRANIAFIDPFSYMLDIRNDRFYRDCVHPKPIAVQVTANAILNIIARHTK